MAVASLTDKQDFQRVILADASLSLSAKVVACRLLLHHNSQTGRCCPSYQTIAEGTAMKRRAAIYAVQELERGGWLTINRAKGTDPKTAGGYVANNFSIDFSRASSLDTSEEFDADPSASPCTTLVHDGAPPSASPCTTLVHDGAPPSASPCTTLVHDGAPPSASPCTTLVHDGAPKYMNRIHEENTVESLSITTRFDEWWKLYPRKVGKDAARPVFEKIVRTGKATPDELIDGARRYAAERASDDPKFTKHPKTWLNGGCWADEPQAAPSTQNGAGRAPGDRRRGFSATQHWLPDRLPSDD